MKSVNLENSLHIRKHHWNSDIFSSKPVKQTMHMIKMLIFSKKWLKNQQKFHPIFCNTLVKIEFRPVRRNVNFVDLEKCRKMRPWSQKSASIQKRTSPPEFLENRGVQNGSAGGHAVAVHKLLCASAQGWRRVKGCGCWGADVKQAKAG